METSARIPQAMTIVVALLVGCGDTGNVGAASGDGSTEQTTGTCAAGEVWCPGCFGGGACYRGGCPGAACPILPEEGGVTSDASASSVGQCQPDAGSPFPQPSMMSPEVRASLTGTNGTFQDTCDANGNLTEYTCEGKQTCGPGPNPACDHWLTGQVIPQTIDCNGRCKDGRCVSRCPKAGDVLVYKVVEASGAATFTNQTDGRVYACAGLGFDKANDGFDCKAAVVGQQIVVIGIGMTGSFCTGGQFGNIAAGTQATEEQCAYVQCRFAD
jgi:hypothetical protein